MVIGTYISIITLNKNRLNAPSKRHRLAEWIKKQNAYICCLQETHFRPRDKYRLKVRGWGKIFLQMKIKKTWSKNSHIGQNRLQNKDYCKRQRRTLHNYQGINPRRRYNNCKYLCTHYRNTSIHKANANNHKRGN